MLLCIATILRSICPLYKICPSSCNTSSLMRAHTFTPYFSRIFAPPARHFSSTIQAHSTTLAPRPIRSSSAAARVPPVAIKSSMTRIRLPGDTAVFDTHSSSPPKKKTQFMTVNKVYHLRRLPVAAEYSLKYSFPVTAFGSLPAFLTMIKGFCSARAMGGPRMNPLASRPAIASIS